MIKKTVISLRRTLFLIGFSTTQNVIHAQMIDANTNKILICQLGVSLKKIWAKESNGQCHKYRGKLINPIQTRNLVDNIFSLTQAFGPP